METVKLEPRCPICLGFERLARLDLETGEGGIVPCNCVLPFRCVMCAWAWLTESDSKVSSFLDLNKNKLTYGRTCKSDFDCFRRQQMKMAQ